MANPRVRCDLLWSRKWIPFVGECGGSKLIVDCDPTAAGTIGQIFEISNYDIVEGVYTDSLDEFLRSGVSHVRNGEFETDNLVISFKEV